MDNAHKHAYRYLLYHAMLDIRQLQWNTHRPLRLVNPWTLLTPLRRASRAGAMADWLHNLAAFSANDFDGFNEERFWQEYDRLLKRHPDVAEYRWIFEHELT